MVVQAGAAAALTEEKTRNLVSHRICSLISLLFEQKFVGRREKILKNRQNLGAGEKPPSVAATFSSSRKWLLAKKKMVPKLQTRTGRARPLCFQPPAHLFGYTFEPLLLPLYFAGGK